MPLCLYAQIYVPVGKIPPPARSKSTRKTAATATTKAPPPSVGATATPLQTLNPEQTPKPQAETRKP